MSIEERQGTIDQVNEKGIVLSGARLSYSKWFEGDRPTLDALGREVTVVVDAGEKCTFLKKIVRIGGKASGWKPPEPGNKGSFGGGPGRRFSPEELELKREEGVRIARSVAIDRAISMVDKGITIDKIADAAYAVEAYLLKGELPQGAKAPEAEVPVKRGPVKPPSAGPAQVSAVANPESPRAPASAKETSSPVPPKPQRLQARKVSALFNEAMRGGIVVDWKDFLVLLRSVLNVEVKDPYQLSTPDFERAESFVRAKLGKSAAA